MPKILKVTKKPNTKFLLNRIEMYRKETEDLNDKGYLSNPKRLANIQLLNECEKEYYELEKKVLNVNRRLIPIRKFDQ